MRVIPIAIAAGLLASPALAQTPPAAAPTTTQIVQNAWNSAKRNIVDSADQMPEADYAFKPVDGVRTFGQILAHVAGTNYVYCSAAKREKSPHAEDDFEKTATTKAAIVKALADSVAYCDAVYAGATDTPRQLIANIAHNAEHYGNLVTYFRIKGMVPPSTKRAGGS